MNFFEDLSRVRMATVAPSLGAGALAEERKGKEEAAIVEEDRVFSLATSILSADMAKTVLDTSCEETMIASARLVVNVGLKALRALHGNKLLEFDALVGDFGCERVALRIYTLVTSPDFKRQAEELSKTLTILSKEIGERPGKRRIGKDRTTPRKFAQDKILSVKVSQEMALLFQAYVLTATKKTYVTTSGNVAEMTEISKLQAFSPTFPGKHLSTVVGELQARLSATLVAYFKEEAGKVSSLGADDKKLLVEMFQPEMVRSNEGDKVTKRKAKSFVCALYSSKTALLRMKELQTYVVLKKLTPKQETISLVFRSTVPGGPFLPVDEEEQKKLKEDCPVIVLEGEGPPIEREELMKRVLEIGLEQLLFVATAQEHSYGIESVSVAPVAHKGAVAEIDRLRGLAIKYGCVKGETPFLQMDHVYCSTVKIELLKGAK